MALVLIVDDNQDIRVLMGRLLEASGFEVIQAAGGREALSLLRNEGPLPDAIVLDVQMPGIDGWDTLKEIRSEERSANIAVLLCTVKGRQSDRARGWQMGCDGYITKPFDAEDFIAAVRAVVGLSPEQRRVMRSDVQVYESESFLAESISEFIIDGLHAGETAIIVATQEHRKAIDELVGNSDLDLQELRNEGRYILLDAVETLSRVMVDGEPEPALFSAAVGAVVASASQAGHGVRIFGEMVGLLWAEGNVAAAIRLEELWDEMAQAHPFSLSRLGSRASVQIGDARDRSAKNRDQRADAQDQESETRDERGEARDQRAEARDEAAVSDRAAAFRDRRGAASDRMQAADDRAAAAPEDRDQRGEAHDQESETRDERDQARDQRAEARDEAAVTDRAAAIRDRRGAASDRMQAADDREAAAGDRVISARERAVSSIDELTGAHRRDAGTLELEREIARAKRAGQPLVLAFVDVDGLKATNDVLGHAAGDQLLRHTVVSMRTHLRSYDLIVRFGGDEFVSALLDLSMSGAAKRFEAINAHLAETGYGSITVGLAELRLEDSLEDLIARADEALYREREQ